jgi:hypothetical protein
MGTTYEMMHHSKSDVTAAAKLDTEDDAICAA